MRSDKSVNTILNESRGKISKKIESSMDLPQDKTLHEIFTKMCDKKYSRRDVEEILITYHMQGFEETLDVIDEEHQYLPIYFILFIMKSIMNKRRLQAINLCCSHRFSRVESSIKQLEDEQLISLYKSLKKYTEDGKYGKITDSLRDINRNIENYADRHTEYTPNNFSESEIRDLKNILTDCIKYTDSNKYILNSISTVLKGQKITEKDVEDMTTESETRSLKGTDLKFVWNTYNNLIRHSIMHGDDRIKYEPEECYFPCDKGDVTLTYDELGQYVFYYIGSIFCIQSIHTITYTEIISRKFEEEWMKSNLNNLLDRSDEIIFE